VFVDEVGFSLLPAAVHTYAPRRQTPFLGVPLTWDHLSVISAITPDGRLFVRIQEVAFKGTTIVRFLKHLLRHIHGNLSIIWEGLPAHRGQAVKDFLRQGAARRIHLERLPGYAPDPSPDEGIWYSLKQVEKKNLCCHNLDALHHELRKGDRMNRGKPMGTQAIYAMLKERALAAGLPKTTPHNSRRTVTGKLLDAVKDAILGAKVLGYSRVETTIRYDRCDKRAKRKAQARLICRNKCGSGAYQLPRQIVWHLFRTFDKIDGIFYNTHQVS
jgi:transposase